MKKQRFQIDFIEFAFLVEACIPPAPISRTYFFQNVIDRYYHEMTPNERRQLFNFINRSCRFDTKEELCAMFNARFDPENQYFVTIKNDDLEYTEETFLYKDEYHVSKSTSILKKYITKVEKITP